MSQILKNNEKFQKKSEDWKLCQSWKIMRNLKNYEWKWIKNLKIMRNKKTDVKYKRPHFVQKSRTS